MKQIIISKCKPGVVEAYVPETPSVKITDPEKMRLYYAYSAHEHVLEYEGVIISRSENWFELDALKKYISCLLKG